jgi:hypothetical protein
MSSCFAFDSGAIKDEWLPKIVEWWNVSFNWINTDVVPWIETNLSVESRQEFQKEFGEAVNEVPVAIQDVWNSIKSLFN